MQANNRNTETNESSYCLRSKIRKWRKSFFRDSLSSPLPPLPSKISSHLNPMEGLWPSNMECVLLTSQTEVTVPFRDSLSSPFPVLPSKISSHLNPMEGLWPSDIGCVLMTSQTEVPVPFKDNLSSPLPPLPSHPSPLTTMEGQILGLF